MSNADTDAEEDVDAGDGTAEDDAAPGDGTTAESAADAHESDTDDLLARVAAVDEELAAEVGELADRAAELEAELSETEDELAERAERIEELESNLKRTKADFRNYKKRTEKRKEQIRERATEDLVERLIDVRDNLVRALQQDANADIRDGVEATLSTFDRVLEDESVEAIHPEPGAEVDPRVHEVVMRVEGDQPEGRVEDVYRPGYRMAGKVLQAAQVTVSEGTGEDAEADDGHGAEADDGGGAADGE